MRAMRTYNRRIYRNTIAFGAALLMAAGVLLAADIWLFATVGAALRSAVGIVVFGLFFFGGAYVLAGLYGLAKAKK